MANGQNERQTRPRVSYTDSCAFSEDKIMTWSNMAISRETEDYGRRLLPNVIEHAATVSPDRIAYSFPISNDPALGFHDINNQSYANGVNRTAWWIEENFGKPEPSSFPSIGYIGPSKWQDCVSLSMRF